MPRSSIAAGYLLASGYADSGEEAIALVRRPRPQTSVPKRLAELLDRHYGEPMVSPGRGPRCPIEDGGSENASLPVIHVDGRQFTWGGVADYRARGRLKLVYASRTSRQQRWIQVLRKSGGTVCLEISRSCAPRISASAGLKRRKFVEKKIVPPGVISSKTRFNSAA